MNHEVADKTNDIINNLPNKEKLKKVSITWCAVYGYMTPIIDIEYYDLNDSDPEEDKVP